MMMPNNMYVVNEFENLEAFGATVIDGGTSLWPPIAESWARRWWNTYMADAAAVANAAAAAAPMLWMAAPAASPMQQRALPLTEDDAEPLASPAAAAAVVTAKAAVAATAATAAPTLWAAAPAVSPFTYTRGREEGRPRKPRKPEPAGASTKRVHKMRLKAKVSELREIKVEKFKTKKILARTKFKVSGLRKAINNYKSTKIGLKKL
jgi:hypothetical protein